MEILIFVFFVIVFVLLLFGGKIVKAIKHAHTSAQQAAEQKEQRYRDETGRQRQQYSQRKTAPREANNAHQSHETYEPHETHKSYETYETHKPHETQTSTGETIIDHRHQERENRKIFDDSDGDYVEFEEA